MFKKAQLRSCPLHEQIDRLQPRVQWRDLPHLLAGDVEGLAACRQDRDRRDATADRRSELGSGVDDVLTVVEHDQQAPIGQPVDDGLDHG